MKKKMLYMLLCVCMLFVFVGCGSTEESETEDTQATADNDEAEDNAQEEETELVNADALDAAVYDGYRVEVLSYEFNEAWQSYDGDPGTNAVCVYFYYENGNEDPLYMLESFGIAAYQDGTELEYISLNAEDEEAQNVITAVEDGASISCMMAFELISDSDVELQITEPTADANLLLELTLEK